MSLVSLMFSVMVIIWLSIHTALDMHDKHQLQNQITRLSEHVFDLNMRSRLLDSDGFIKDAERIIETYKLGQPDCVGSTSCYEHTKTFKEKLALLVQRTIAANINTHVNSYKQQMRDQLPHVYGTQPDASTERDSQAESEPKLVKLPNMGKDII